MNGKQMISLGVRLALFVAAVVAMLSVVNFLTRDTIAERIRAEGEAARSELMQDCVFTEETQVEYPKDTSVTAVYRAEKDGVLMGYCFDVSVKGYNEISMIVGVSVDGKVTGVKILSQTETPGIGSKAVDENGTYLPLFAKKDLSEMQQYFVSGAAISSKGIWNGVNDAVELSKLLSEGKGA